MSPRLLAVAALFAATATALIAYKVTALGYELAPSPSPDRWSVQTEVRLRGVREKARVAFYLPADGPTQRIYDERVTAEGMRFYIRPRERNRMGVAVGRPETDDTQVSYRFSVQTKPPPPGEPPLATEEAEETGAEELKDFLAPDEAIQSDAPAVGRWLDELAIRRDDRAVALRQLAEAVARELETSDGHDGPQDALAVLERERGGLQGKARAAVALLRAARIPARVVVGVRLIEGADQPLTHWVEAHLAGAWWPLDPATGRVGSLPEPRLVLHVGDSPALEASGVDDVSYRVSMLREQRTQAILAERKEKKDAHLLDRLSLYALPVKTQVLFRVLLLVPLGALVVAIFRNLVGVPTFGVFMPILVSLAFRESGLGWGFLLLGVVVAIGYLGRHLLDRAQLLLVPRLGFLLTLVILIMAAVMVIAEALGADRALSVALFPIVILTMTIERLSITLIEEGPRNAAKVVAGTALVSTCGYLVIANDALQHFVFTFPEIHLVTMAVLLVLGRYTGYRLSEWARFRAFRESDARRPA